MSLSALQRTAQLFNQTHACVFSMHSSPPISGLMSPYLLGPKTILLPLSGVKTQAACKSSRPGQTCPNPIGRGQITSPHVHVPLFLPMDWPHPARGLPLAIAWRPTSCMRAYASGMQIKPAGANVPKSHRAGPNHVASCACALILAHGLAASGRRASTSYSLDKCSVDILARSGVITPSTLRRPAARRSTSGLLFDS